MKTYIVNWQPIETAPKDGTRILVCGGTRADSGDFCEHYYPFEGPTIAHWDQVGWKGGYSGHDENCWWHKPTYWTLLPLPPLPPRRHTET